jgi:hypothetical protein
VLGSGSTLIFGEMMADVHCSVTVQGLYVFLRDQVGSDPTNSTFNGSTITSALPP